MKNLILPLLLLLPFHAFAQWNGDPFANDRARCQFITEVPTYPQQAIIAQSMGSHMMRMYHWLWHTSRNAWTQLNGQQRKMVQGISNEWGHHAPICPAPRGNPGNAAGEEFLRMHHLMIDELRVQLVANNLPCINAWDAIPAADDATWIVPPTNDPKDISKFPQMDRVLQIWAMTFNDTNWLANHSLSEVGYMLEFTIHNNMHSRFATIPSEGDQYDPLAAGITTSGGLMNPSPFDAANFNWLGNPYSAAGNPVFWKLHGWVDNVIVRWVHANGYSRIADNCAGVAGCYQWKSTWLGGMPAAPASNEPTGGGMSSDMPGMSMAAPTRGAGQKNIGAALGRLSSFGDFRNRAFDNALNGPTRGGGGAVGGAVGGSGPGDRTSDEQGFPLNIEDPADFIDMYGPCSQ